MMKYAIYGKVDNINLPFIRDDNNPDYVFSFGGDGTMLGAIHRYINKLSTVKFIGINVGKLGFFTDFSMNELDYICQLLETKEYDINKYNLLEYTLQNDLKKVTGYAVNELAIINAVHTQIIDVFINDNHFETFRGTGLLISPPAGSTAYNKSLGGGVIDPHISAIQLTEIAPINNRVYKSLSSPLILSEKSRISLFVHSDEKLYLSVDGTYLHFENLKTVTSKLSDQTVTFIVKKNTNFFNRVKRAFIE